MSLRLELVPPAVDTASPHPRSGHKVVVDQGNLYALGGYNPDVVDSDLEDPREIEKRIFVQMWRFNFFSRRWKELNMTGDFPRCLASHTATLHGHTLLTFGGSGIPFGIVSSCDVHKCHVDPNSDTVKWTRLEVTGDVPESKYGHCQLLLGKHFYLVGGTTGFIYNTDVHRLDLETGTWQCIFDSPRGEDNVNEDEQDIHNPIGRYRHEVAFHNNKILMIGGGQASRAFSLEKIPCFNLELSQWEQLQTSPAVFDREQKVPVTGIPPARRCHSCVKFKNNVFVYGGRNVEEVLGDLWRLHLDTLQWTCIVFAHASPLKCFFHAADVTESGCMYILGGVTNDNEEVRTNAVHRVWLVVPVLQELAWSVISQRLHHDRSSDLPCRLLHAGVPREFTQRLTS
ncbi:kelch domain-containing protein 10-like [Littorina saxatilis]|uniref:Kelch domain-containing protein 10 n=1 Tax=Littorina saxatilis TaxID=31220 RepID=A0AAN9GBW7_9CAEN